MEEEEEDDDDEEEEEEERRRPVCCPKAHRHRHRRRKKQNKRRTISYRVFLLFLFPTEFSFFFLSYQTKKNQREICSASIEKRDDIFYFVVHLTFLWCVGG